MRVLLATGAMWPEPGGVPLVGAERGASASVVAEALGQGWRSRRPTDELTLLPLPDGGPGSASVLDSQRVETRIALHARGPLGQVREVDLLRLAASGGGAAGARTWFLDAGRLLSLPADPQQGLREAREGSSVGLGKVLSQALATIGAGDVLVVGLSRSAVHDGGAGLLEGLGGREGARQRLHGREMVLALADDCALGGMSGAGQGLAVLTGMEAQEAQDLDRQACSVASRILSELATPRPGALPVIGSEPTIAQVLSTSSWGTGACGGSALVLRALGCRAVPGARVMAHLLGLEQALAEQDLVVTSSGEVYDVLADCVTAVVGQAASEFALPTVLVAGRARVPRGELASAGVVSAYSLEEMGAGTGPSWDEGGPQGLHSRLVEMGSRLARTWSR